MILITGASSGLGAALAALYAKDNQALTLTGAMPIACIPWPMPSAHFRPKASAPLVPI